MNRNLFRFSSAAALSLTLCGSAFLSPQALAQPGQVNKMQPQGGTGENSGQNSSQAAPTNNLANGISGNVPDAGPADTTYGVNSPGRLIGPAPENGQPDPRFPNERDTSSGGDNDANSKSTAAGSAQAPVPSIGDKSAPGATGQGMTSNLNEGLPSASQDNSGANSGTGSGGPGGAPGTGGNAGNPGGDARPNAGASQSTENPSDVGRETRGAAPYALAAGAVMIGGFLVTMLWARAKKNR